MAVPAQGSAPNRRFVATAEVLLLKRGCGGCPCVEPSEPRQGKLWRSTNKAVHTHAVCSHRRSFVNAAGCGGWPPRREKRAVCRAKQAEARECLAVHTPGGLWPLQGSCYLSGVPGLTPVSGKASCMSTEASRGKVRFGGAHTRRSVATTGVLLFKRGCRGLPPAWREASYLLSEASRGKKTFGGSHTRRCTHQAVLSHCKSVVI